MPETPSHRTLTADKLALALTVFIAVVLVSLVVMLSARALAPAAGGGWTSMDMVAAILGVMAVAFNILLVFLAVVAIFGYQFLANAAEKRGKEAAEERVKAYLNSEDFAGVLAAMVDDAVEDIIQTRSHLFELVEKAGENDMTGDLERAIREAGGEGDDETIPDRPGR
ncbi:MAG: hypothetical protein AAGC95_16850 [Pseudomonadota bacterium]